MIVAAIVTGLVTSYYLAAIYSRLFMMLFYHAPFRFWKPYLALYDMLESRYSYELLGGESRFKNHLAFLEKYSALRPRATEHFKRLWDTYTRQIGLIYGLTLLISFGVFRGVYWAFIGPFLIVQLTALAHLYFVKQYGADLFASLMVSLLLSE